MPLADNGPYIVDAEKTNAVRDLEKAMGRSYFGPISDEEARRLLSDAYKRRANLNKAIFEVEALLGLPNYLEP